LLKSAVYSGTDLEQDVAGCRESNITFPSSGERCLTIEGPLRGIAPEAPSVYISK